MLGVLIHGDGHSFARMSIKFPRLVFILYLHTFCRLSWLSTHLSLHLGVKPTICAPVSIHPLSLHPPNYLCIHVSTS